MKLYSPEEFAFCDSPFACTAAPIISRKWVPVIVCHLSHGSRRFNELRRAIPHLSAKVLSENLERMENEELLLQEGTNLNQIRYKLTKKGEGLLVVIRAMNEWGERWLLRSTHDKSKIITLESAVSA